MKKIIREIIALIILLLAIMLMIVMFFFDYIKSDSNQPQAATYQMTENELEILKEKDNYSNTNSENKIVLSTDYTLTEEELSKYKATGELKTGQSNPFDETAVTGVLYDAEGNAYYKTVTSKNEGQTSSTWYGTVSGNSVVPTQTVSTEATKTPVPTVTPTSTPAPTPTPNQAYNPDTDITAPSSDSGNLSQPTGGK